MTSPELKKQIDDLIENMTPEIYERLRTAVELGKWPDGNPLTADQKTNTLQLVMLWQAKHNDDNQHMSIAKGGEIVHKSKQELKAQFNHEQISISNVDQDPKLPS